MDGQFRIGRNYRLGMRAVGSNHLDAEAGELNGHMVDVGFRKEGRNLSYGAMHFSISPDFRTDTGFVLRTDQHQTGVNMNYRWWPQSWIINWGPRADYLRDYAYDGTLQDEQTGLGMQVQFAKNIFVNGSFDKDMERYGGIDFDKTRYGFGGGVNTSRKISFGGFFNQGDEIRYVENPFLGDGTTYQVFTNVRPFTRLQADFNLNASKLVEPHTNLELFYIKIYRLQATYQFSDRLLLRNILDFNDYDRTVGGNILLTYRVNSGTAFYVGYDDRYKQGDLIDPNLFPTTDLMRTNRAVFAKMQVLFRVLTPFGSRRCTRSTARLILVLP